MLGGSIWADNGPINTDAGPALGCTDREDKSNLVKTLSFQQHWILLSLFFSVFFIFFGSTG